MKEIELSGGAVSSPVKVGNTVRRVAGPWTPTIHGLLDYLADHGFDLAPRPLGVDEKGREILTFMPGEAAHRPWPPVLKSDDGLRQVAKMLRDYHDVIVNFVPPIDAVWRLGKVAHKPGDIIRHGDLGPWNTLWKERDLVALLDWDFAQPGNRITDLAQLAWYFAPMRGDEGWVKAGFVQLPDLRHRVNVICEGYGGYSSEELLNELDQLQHKDLELTARLGGAGVHPWNLFYNRVGMAMIE